MFTTVAPALTTASTTRARYSYRYGLHPQHRTQRPQHTFSILDSSYSTFDNFLAGRIELILDMTVAGTDTGMDSLMLGILQSLSSTINIFSTARVSAQIVGQVTALEISTTELKSPGLDIGNPASITSTPNCSSCFATWIFSTVFNWHPGTCSPSRRVVSKCIICHSYLKFKFTPYNIRATHSERTTFI